MPTFQDFATTVVASGVGAHAAGAIGFRYGIAKFQGERVFDKQLAWYEKATSSLLTAASKLNWAISTERAGMPAPDVDRAWAEAISNLLTIRQLEIEAEMYASPESYDALSDALGEILTVAETAPVIRRSPAASVPVQAELFVIVVKLLYHAASRLANDVRSHLKLPEVSREIRLYDRDFRELHEELASLGNRDAALGLAVRAGGPSQDRPLP